MPKQIGTLGKQIIELINQGYSRKEIKNKLNCCRSRVDYYYYPKQKLCCKKCNKNRYDSLHPYSKKLTAFRQPIKIKNVINQPTGNKNLLYLKIYKWYTTKNKKENTMNTDKITLKDIINKFGENPKCGLTGEQLDINKPRTYQFDHIIPRSRGGSNSLDNMQIVTRQANLSKSDMTNEEFFKFCQLILEQQGFTVIKE